MFLFSIVYYHNEYTMKEGDNMTGYFQEITNPFSQTEGFNLSKVIKDFGNGTVLGEVDESTLPAWKRVLLEAPQKLNNLLPVID